MISDKERMIEWLNRSSEQIHLLRKKPRLSDEQKLKIIRENYQVINVLTMVVNGEAYMMGINPPAILPETD